MIATRLTGSYTNFAGSDGGRETSNADSPPINLQGVSEPTLTFWAYVDTEGITYDGFKVQASTNGGATYATITTVAPTYPLTILGEGAWGGRQAAAGYQQFSANLSGLGASTVNVRITFLADFSVNGAGVYVDDVAVRAANEVPLAISTSSIPDAPIGSAYSAPLVRFGGSTAAVWSIVSSTNAGWLSIDPSTGALSGTPMAGNSGTASFTVRVAEPGNPTNFAERPFSIMVFSEPTVTSIAVTGLPNAQFADGGVATLADGGISVMTPGWGLASNAGNLYFTVTDSASKTQVGSARGGGIGYVPLAGGAYTSFYDANQAGVLDPQVIFFNGATLNAFNGLFSPVRGTAGLYAVTGASAATALTTNTAPFSTGTKYGWNASGANFYFAQYFPAPYDIIGANVNVTAPVPMTNVTNDGNFDGPFGVAASATKLYVFDGVLEVYELDGALSPSVPMTTMTPPVTLAQASPCTWLGRTLTAPNSPMFPTKIYFTAWDGDAAGVSGRSMNRICQINLDSMGWPAGPATVVAGPSTATAAAGSADGLASVATFQDITALHFDTVSGRLYVLQKANSVSPANLIRVIQP